MRKPALKPRPDPREASWCWSPLSCDSCAPAISSKMKLFTDTNKGCTLVCDYAMGFSELNKTSLHQGPTFAEWLHHNPYHSTKDMDMDVTRTWHNLADNARMHEYSCKCICSQVVRPSVLLHSHIRVSVCVYLYILHTVLYFSVPSLTLYTYITHTHIYIYTYANIHTHIDAPYNILRLCYRDDPPIDRTRNVWPKLGRGFIMSFARLTCFPVEDHAAKPVRHSWPGHDQRRRRLSSNRS